MQIGYSHNPIWNYEIKRLWSGRTRVGELMFPDIEMVQDYFIWFSQELIRLKPHDQPYATVDGWHNKIIQLLRW